METVDRDRAGLIIREQNRMAYVRLRRLLAKQGREAGTLAETLTPWIDKASVRIRRKSPYGEIRPEALLSLQSACKWAVTADNETISSSSAIIPAGGYPHFGLRRELESAYDFGQASRTFTQEYIENTVRRVRDRLKSCAEEIQRFQVPEQLIRIPDVHPPRHAQLKKGVLARLVVEDLEVQIEAGRALEASWAVGRYEKLATGAWRKTMERILTGLTAPDVAGGFTWVTWCTRACESSVVDTRMLDRAYLAFGITYLEEVVERMPDYAEASGQMEPKPGVSMTFSGGTFYGGQFAAQIANIDSTIAGVVKHGKTDIADALKALEQAVISQDELNEEQRRDLLDNIGYLAEAAQAPPEKRNRGIVKSVLTALKVAASSGGALNEAMNAWGAILHKLVS